MATVSVYNLEKKEVGTCEVPEVLVSTEWKPDLVHQVVVAQLANARNHVAHTKDRSEVRGGGRKPWRQKGTGRARHGSTRSPLWVGGGVTFGPRNERILEKKINTTMRRVALYSVFSKKYGDKEIVIVDSFAPLTEQIKTKQFKDTVSKLMEGHKKALCIFSQEHKDLARAARNIPFVSYMSPRSMNAKDILGSSLIIIEQEALGEFVTHCKLS
jgi:large subunit ribosomal protein L4